MDVGGDVSQWLRLLAQFGRANGASNGNSNGSETSSDSSVTHAVRQLQITCQSGGGPSDLLPRALPGLARAFQRTVSQTSPTSDTVYLLLAILEFYLTFGEEVLHEADKTFHGFFRSFLSRQYADPFVAVAVTTFLNQQKSKLLTLYPTLLPQHFPLLLKIQAWHTPKVDVEMLDLFPAMVAPASFLSLFPSLLDLPTLVLALEDYEKTAGSLPGEPASAAPKPPAPEDVLALMDAAYTGSTVTGRADSDSGDEAGERRGWESVAALFKELMKDENDGLMEGHWSHPGLPAALLSSLGTSPSDRLQGVVQIVPKLLRIYFEVALRDVEDERLAALLMMLFQRVDSMFPHPIFCREVQQACLEFTLSVFERSPALVAVLKKPIIACIGQPFATPAKAELAMHLCWAVGEYGGGGEGHRGEAIQLFECIELLLYENLAASIAAVKDPEPELKSSKGGVSMGSSYNRPRLLCFAITALSKIATCHRDLDPRARVCLLKVTRSSQFLDKRVTRNAIEHLGLMRSPAICSKILIPWRGERGEKGEKEGQSGWQDRTEVLRGKVQAPATISLPFCILSERRGLPLHDFSLDDVMIS